MKITPLLIEVAFHYVYRGSNPFPRESKEVREVVKYFEKMGFLRISDSNRAGRRYQATGGLFAYTDALLAVPLPVHRWISEDQWKEINGVK